MPLRAIARLIQTMLYAQRFFPYYVYNILGGIEDDGAFPFALILHRISTSLSTLAFPSVDETGIPYRGMVQSLRAVRVTVPTNPHIDCIVPRPFPRARA